ncbi:MAG: amino acid aminotransferase [Planctomycetota bacterium]
MFQDVQAAPPDAILGLTEAFKGDANPEKINLGVGIYKDAAGKTPVLETVCEASRRLLDGLETKAYLPIPGDAAYCAAVQRLMFGAEHEVVTSGRAMTAHTPGGTGALRVVGDFLKQNLPAATLHLTDPTWANHPAVFAAAGVATETVPYFDRATNGLAFDALLAAVEALPAGDALLLHGCCHNPTGIDPTAEQWKRLADAVYARGVLPIIDFAYQGFAEGIDEDAAGLREFARPEAEFVVCSSFSKNFGLYRERVGAVTFVAESPERRATIASQAKRCIRTLYSNPPAHGAALVTTILEDAELSCKWYGEVATMRGRINQMRGLLVATLAEKGATGDYAFIERQRGMFSFSGLTNEQVARLREEDSIYIVGSGRINVAGVTEANVDRLAAAIARVAG